MVKRLYLLSAVLGFLLPYSFFVPFVIENGLNISLLVQQMFANQIATFFALDVIVSSFVLWIFVFSEGRRFGMRNLWGYVALNLAVGVALALPLFLYFREKAREERESKQPAPAN
jgi:hypothetical protein